MRVRTVSPEVLYPDEPIIRVTRENLQQLAEAALAAPRQRIRLCTHTGPGDAVHEMLIIHTSDTYVRPHKHLGKTESFHVFQGTADVIVFDEGGGVEDVIPMGDFASGRVCYYRMNVPRYHTLLIESPVLIFHECTGGPFNPADTVFPPWAPDGASPEEAKRYMAAAREAAGRWKA